MVSKKVDGVYILIHIRLKQIGSQMVS